MKATVTFTFLSLLLAAGAHGQSERATLLERAGESRAKGSPDAPVLVYEIADFQCPYCGAFARDVFPRIDSAFIRPGRVQWVFVNLPVPSHRAAWAASEAALCAGAVSDRFWVMHDRLYVAGREWIDAEDPATVVARYARDAGVAMDEFNDCVERDRVVPILLQDVIFGSRVTGTPTFIIDNKETIVGVKPFEDWVVVIERVLRGK